VLLDQNEGGERRLLIVSGFSGGGKTTLCSALARITGSQPVRTSDFLIRRLGEQRDKEGRLFAWQDRETDLLTEREVLVFAEADNDHLRVVRETPGGVHESMTLPLLLDSAADTCRVFLDVDSEIRYRRVAARHGIDLEDARTLVVRKDAQTRLYIETAYGLFVGSEAHLGHYDAVIRVSGDGTTHWRIGSVSATNRGLLERAVQQVEQEVGSA